MQISIPLNSASDEKYLLKCVFMSVFIGFTPGNVSHLHLAFGLRQSLITKTLCLDLAPR